MNAQVNSETHTSRTARPAHEIVARKMSFDFDPEAIPKWWFGGNPIISHQANGMHMLFPEGERFFIRSVKYFMKDIDDPELKHRVRQFFLQEAQHGKEHGHSFEMLTEQGYDVKKFLDRYEKKMLPALEKFGPKILGLSVTVALEHLTATMGANALTDPYLNKAHPTMQALLRWHAAEEIEHKSVAFDVLKAVNPNYFIRAAGMVIALLGLGFFSGKAYKMMLEQDGLSEEDLEPYVEEAKQRELYFKKLFRKAVRKYLRRDFHPDDENNYHLAEKYLDSVGRLAA